jgi:hypothetical protein
LLDAAELAHQFIRLDELGDVDAPPRPLLAAAPRTRRPFLPGIDRMVLTY